MQHLSNPDYIRKIMRKHGFGLSKRLGQNFIADPDICPKIARCSGAGENIGALEIGPGLGVLTAELSVLCKKVVAVEIDKRLMPVLDETLAGLENVTVICADILRIDLKSLLSEHFGDMDVIVCANLPYYITSPIVMALLEARLPIKSITVMVQKEAAERLCAAIPSRAMGAVTVAVNWYSVPEMLFEVPAEAFMPPPDVTSAVIRLDIRKEPPVPVRDTAMLFRVVQAAFSQRRKTVLNCLSSFFGIDKPQISGILISAGVPPAARGEQLSLTDFAAISDLLFLL